MKTLKFTITLLALSYATFSTAQLTLERSVIGSAGSNEVGSSNLTTTWTTGETVIGTGENGSLTLSQGFQQPNDAPGVSVEVNDPVVDLSVYPNPTQDKITVKVDAATDQTLYYSVYDMLGKRIALPEEKLHVSGQSETVIDFSHLPKASYFLQINDEKGRQVASLRIVKM